MRIRHNRYYTEITFSKLSESGKTTCFTFMSSRKNGKYDTYTWRDWYFKRHSLMLGWRTKDIRII